MYIAVSVALALALAAWRAELVLLVVLAAPAHFLVRSLRGDSVTRGVGSLDLREVEAAHVLASCLPRMALLLLRHRQVLLLQLLRFSQVEAKAEFRLRVDRRDRVGTLSGSLVIARR